jgi:hypothetical protein
MSESVASSFQELLAKPRLNVGEMTRLLAGAVSGLPNVRKVDVIENMELAVSLTSGKRIEVQTLPLVARLNGSETDRKAMIEDVLARCA